MLTGFIATLALLLSFPLSALADDTHVIRTQDESFVETSARSLRIFAEARGLDPEKPSREFIGFHSRAGAQGASVEFFSRWNQYDAWIDGFDCKSTDTAVDCLKVSGQPRCFYSPDTGRFSISDAIEALHLSMAQLPNSTSSLRTLKFWQSGAALYGKVLTTENSQDSKGIRFLCARLESGLQCRIYEQTENEP